MSILDYDTEVINENTPFERVAVVTPVAEIKLYRGKLLKKTVDVNGVTVYKEFLPYKYKIV